jgi:hypothetical protein
MLSARPRRLFWGPLCFSCFSDLLTILFFISDSLLLLTGLTGQATKQGHKTPMAINDILRLQATTFAMAMRKNARPTHTR